MKVTPWLITATVTGGWRIQVLERIWFVSRSGDGFIVTESVPNMVTGGVFIIQDCKSEIEALHEAMCEIAWKL